MFESETFGQRIVQARSAALEAGGRRVGQDLLALGSHQQVVMLELGVSMVGAVPRHSEKGPCQFYAWNIEHTSYLRTARISSKVFPYCAKVKPPVGRSQIGHRRETLVTSVGFIVRVVRSKQVNEGIKVWVSRSLFIVYR